jgi:two-component system, OmpR family, response regulator CpxR
LNSTSSAFDVRNPDREKSKPRNVLLVDDDLSLCSLITEFLNAQGFTVHAVHSGQAGIARALTGTYDLILLDIMLPIQDGFEVLREVRSQSNIPIIMLTARAEQQDRVAGLNWGADDYLAKPFGPQELLARIRAVLRRTEHTQDTGVLRVGDIALNTHARNVMQGNRHIALTSFEFDILSALMRTAGRVVSRDKIAEILYNRESTPFERAIDVHVSHLRKKIETDGQVRIRTVRGIGYIFAVAGDEG